MNFWNKMFSSPLDRYLSEMAGSKGTFRNVSPTLYFFFPKSELFWNQDALDHSLWECESVLGTVFSKKDPALPSWHLHASLGTATQSENS